MTRKHFQALAAMLKQAKPIGAGMDRYCWHRLCHQLADFCQSQNARFDRAKFLEACGTVK